MGPLWRPHLSSTFRLALDSRVQLPVLGQMRAEAYSSLGLAYGEMGRFNEALEFLHRATELYPQGDPAVSSNLGA
jgi:hypothetical protein